MAPLTFWAGPKGVKKINPVFNDAHPRYWRGLNGYWLFKQSMSSNAVVIYKNELLPKEIQLYLMLES